MQIALRFFALLILSLALPTLAGAEESTLAKGKRLVQVNCTPCHATGVTGDSPFKPAPPFREIAKNYDQDELVDGFMDGLAVRHPAMPDWDMTIDQAEEIATYIMSLKQFAGKTDESPELRGFALLRENCARCHAIDETGQSPLAKAPPFRDVVKRYDPANLEEALAEGIVTGHNEMPEFAFTPDQITDIIAYLDSLRDQ